MTRVRGVGPEAPDTEHFCGCYLRCVGSRRYREVGPDAPCTGGGRGRGGQDLGPGGRARPSTSLTGHQHFCAGGGG